MSILTLGLFILTLIILIHLSTSMYFVAVLPVYQNPHERVLGGSCPADLGGTAVRQKIAVTV